MLFQFELMDVDGVPGHRFVPRKWQLSEIKSITNKWQEGLEEGGSFRRPSVQLPQEDGTVTTWRITINPAQSRDSGPRAIPS